MEAPYDGVAMIAAPLPFWSVTRSTLISSDTMGVPVMERRDFDNWVVVDVSPAMGVNASEVSVSDPEVGEMIEMEREDGRANESFSKVTLSDTTKHASIPLISLTLFIVESIPVPVKVIGYDNVIPPSSLSCVPDMSVTDVVTIPLW